MSVHGLGLAVAATILFGVVVYGTYRGIRARAPSYDAPDFDYDAFDATCNDRIDAILSVAKRRFGYEQQRRASIETKLSIVVGLDGVLLAVVGSNPSVIGSNAALVAFLFTAGSVGLGILTLAQNVYEYPGEKMHYHNEYARGDQDPRLPILHDYVEKEAVNTTSNAERFAVYEACLWLTAAALAILFFAFVRGSFF